MQKSRSTRPTCWSSPKSAAAARSDAACADLLLCRRAARAAPPTPRLRHAWTGSVGSVSPSTSRASGARPRDCCFGACWGVVGPLTPVRRSLGCHGRSVRPGAAEVSTDGVACWCSSIPGVSQRWISAILAPALRSGESLDATALTFALPVRASAASTSAVRTPLLLRSENVHTVGASVCKSGVERELGAVGGM